MSQELPSFDLVVATIGRVSELDHLLTSLEFQTHTDFRVIVVDQNPDESSRPALATTGLEVVHVRSAPGLSRARNVGLAHVAR